MFRFNPTLIRNLTPEEREHYQLMPTVTEEIETGYVALADTRIEALHQELDARAAQTQFNRIYHRGFEEGVRFQKAQSTLPFKSR